MFPGQQRSSILGSGCGAPVRALSPTKLSSGGDWITVGSDRVARLDVRATIRTHDDELVFLTVTGRATMSDEVINRLFAGETIGWEEMHARSAPLFETGADGYAWLNSAAAVKNCPSTTSTTRLQHPMISGSHTFASGGCPREASSHRRRRVREEGGA
ncbi:DUF3237 domain-containing protein [Nonomuraea cavernae]|uniref:Uncharacterized protein n=1 Tax=Nonomuraea cavernae TaxID=2045107 RepID=A0A918DUE3_9ACTN|nr:DUF3237 domain-containing protein [Nonomuraea cavernae]MCA2190997.1 DUF3237 domain-containing protein [Nonomuraea cavernae]GGO83681.1 hypothetical protein GCM10012289_77660 [Nonomuraea cavernae]